MLWKKEIRKEICALVFLSLGGWLLHLRLHPIQVTADNPQNPANLVPFIFGLTNIIATPVLLNFHRTFVIGYLLNGIAVAFGSIIMGHVSLSALPYPLTLSSLFLGTTLPSILMLFSKLFIGQRILLHYHPHGMGRMFTASWWLRHFCYLTGVYAIGHFLWR